MKGRKGVREGGKNVLMEDFTESKFKEFKYMAYLSLAIE